METYLEFLLEHGAHLMSIKDGISSLRRLILFTPSLGNIYQNLSVSSPAPVTMLSPSGDIPKYRTLKECPVKV
jgi:hypothetical protein